MIYIKGILFQWFINLLIKKSTLLLEKSASSEAIKNENILNKELAESCTKQLLENLRNKKCTHLLWTIFGVLTFLICNK